MQKVVSISTFSIFLVQELVVTLPSRNVCSSNASWDMFLRCGNHSSHKALVVGRVGRYPADNLIQELCEFGPVGLRKVPSRFRIRVNCWDLETKGCEDGSVLGVWKVAEHCASGGEREIV